MHEEVRVETKLNQIWDFVQFLVHPGHTSAWSNRDHVTEMLDYINDAVDHQIMEWYSWEMEAYKRGASENGLGPQIDPTPLIKTRIQHCMEERIDYCKGTRKPYQDADVAEKAHDTILDYVLLDFGPVLKWRRKSTRWGDLFEERAKEAGFPNLVADISQRVRDLVFDEML